jgi:ubiquinone/menaquinone biosynthesis C-methylase UbiE
VKSSERGPDARVSQSEIAALYDKLAGVYDLWAALTESRARNRALDLAEIRDGQAILEVAVGTGIAFLEMVRRNPHGLNVGVDLSRKMLRGAAQRMKKLDASNYLLTLGTAFALPLKGNSIDLLTNSYMFDLARFDDMGVILSEFKRVLKRNGRMVLVNSTKGLKPASRLYDLVYRLSPKLIGGCRSVAMSGILKDNGFVVQTREYLEQLLLPSEVIVASPSRD